jgi:hypothetical protein
MSRPSSSCLRISSSFWQFPWCSPLSSSSTYYLNLLPLSLPPFIHSFYKAKGLKDSLPFLWVYSLFSSHWASLGATSFFLKRIALLFFICRFFLKRPALFLFIWSFSLSVLLYFSSSVAFPLSDLLCIYSFGFQVPFYPSDLLAW